MDLQKKKLAKTNVFGFATVQSSLVTMSFWISVSTNGSFPSFSGMISVPLPLYHTMVSNLQDSLQVVTPMMQVSCSIMPSQMYISLLSNQMLIVMIVLAAGHYNMKAGCGEKESDHPTFSTRKFMVLPADTTVRRKMERIRG